jgi:hypothetical protein
MTDRLFPCPNITDELPILLRAYVESDKRDRKSARPSSQRVIQSASDWSLVFDTETTTDPGQALRVGFCRIYYRDELRRHVLFYDDGLGGNDLKVVKQYVGSGVELMTRTEFIDAIFYKYGYHLRAMIVGFNLPFDLSRLAIGHASARGTMRGGFSLKLSPHNYQPPIQIKHLSKYVSMIRFAAPFVSPNSRSQLKHGRKNPHKRGYFLEVRALAAALFSRSFTLASLAEFLGVAHGILGADSVLGHFGLGRHFRDDLVMLLEGRLIDDALHVGDGEFLAVLRASNHLVAGFLGRVRLRQQIETADRQAQIPKVSGYGKIATPHKIECCVVGPAEFTVQPRQPFAVLGVIDLSVCQATTDLDDVADDALAQRPNDGSMFGKGNLVEQFVWCGDLHLSSHHATAAARASWHAIDGNRLESS